MAINENNGELDVIIFSPTSFRRWLLRPCQKVVLGQISIFIFNFISHKDISCVF